MDSALSKSKLIFVRNEENDTVEDVAFTVVERDFAAMQSIRETESAERIKIKMREFEHKQLQLTLEDRQRGREHEERMLQLQLEHEDRQRQREQEHTEAMRIISECHGEERVKLLSILWKKDSPAKMRRNSI